MRDIGIWIAGIVFLCACIYILFFWDDPAIRRLEEGMERERKRIESDKEPINEQ